MSASRILTALLRYVEFGFDVMAVEPGVARSRQAGQVAESLVAPALLVAVGEMVQDAVVTRSFLASRGARPPDFLVTLEGRRHAAAIDALDAFRQHRRIFD